MVKQLQEFAVRVLYLLKKMVVIILLCRLNIIYCDILNFSSVILLKAIMINSFRIPRGLQISYNSVAMYKMCVLILLGY